MARQRPQHFPPVEALPDGEPNRRLARIKSSLCKRWSVTSGKTLYEIAELAVYLWALGRAAEAVAVAGAVATAVPGPPLFGGGMNYSVWCPATHSHALIVRLGATLVPERAAASRAALLADAGIARTNPEALAERVVKAGELAATPPDPRGDDVGAPSPRGCRLRAGVVRRTRGGRRCVLHAARLDRGNLGPAVAVGRG